MNKEEINELKLENPIHPRLCPSHVILPLEWMHENTIHELSCLNSLLSEIGVSLSLKHKTMDGYSCDLLCIEFNSDTYLQKTNRNAGRKTDANKHGRYTECTVSEFKNMIDTMKHKDIIEYLKCPRATFYRVLRNLRERDDWENNALSIWFYTS